MGMGGVTLDRYRLMQLYEDALKTKEIVPGLSSHWARAGLCLDTSQLLVLARLVGDPFPWQGILRVLRLYQAEGEEVGDALAHVLKVAGDLLQAQGLELIRPQDVAHATPAMIAAVGTIRRGRK